MPHYRMNEQDREHITHKYYLPELPHDGLRRFDYHGYEYDPSTGSDEDAIKAGLHELSLSYPDEVPHSLVKAKAIEYILDNTRIDVNNFDWYVGIHCWGRVIRKDFINVWEQRMWQEKEPDVRRQMDELKASGLADVWIDYDHAVPDWDAILGLGFPGLRQRARDVRAENERKAPLTAAQTAYYDSIEITLSAVLRLIRRFRAYGGTQPGEKMPRILRCLEQLENGAPTDTYEALQLMYLYFMVSESVEGYQVRSLGSGFDRAIYPFYKKDLESGRYTERELDDFIAYFLMEFYAIGNEMGQPLFLGGTNPDGTTKYNAVSRRVLSIWDDLDIHNPKIQVLFGESTPKDIRYQIYDIFRRGKYMTVICEPGAIEAVRTAVDCTDAQAKDFIVSGCYEPLVRGGILIEAGYPNLLKLVTLALRDGFDPMTKKQLGPHTGLEFDSFDAFFGAYEEQFAALFARLVAMANANERYLSYLNPAILLSATKSESLERMEDGYSMANPFYSSLFELNGYGSAVDALLAVRRLVFDTHTVTLEELRRALDANWEGYEELRRMAKDECPKYGNADPSADALAKRVSELIPKHVLCHRNIRGARYIVEYHGAMEYAWQGALTEATPDGRKLGGETSRNASPTIGADVKGSTALVLSCTSAVRPGTAPGGYNADIMLHPSAVRGEEGLAAMDALVTVYMKRMGIDIQFNIVSPETLRDAQAHPEQYKNLQIRVTGWNVLWNDIPRELQNAYILRAETVTGD